MSIESHLLTSPNLSDAHWFTSSYSDNGNNCVEVADLTNADWFTSSYSGNGNNCVEVADLATRIHGGVAFRDSKAREIPAVLVTPNGWASFVSAIKSGDFPAV